VPTRETLILAMSMNSRPKFNNKMCKDSQMS